MVAICTGPAFATDDAGNLILAGERRKANPTPCALKDCNGLYTDPGGGVYTPDHVYGTWLLNNRVFPGTVIPAGTIINYPFATVNFNNPTCWPLLVDVTCEFGCWSLINRNGVSWLEVGAAWNSGALVWEVVESGNYFADATQPAAYDWFVTSTQPVGQIRLEAHTTQSLQVAMRINNRIAGGQAANGNYRVSAVGYSVS